MDKYTQITLDDWVEMKERLKRELIGVQESFVRIGYTLRKINDQKLYEQDGYKNITEFAKAEYGLNPTTVSRFMAINRKYSIDGYSDELRPEFTKFGSSKLSEMLSLPDQDLNMIKPEAARESIRELKQFNNEQPEAGIADDILALIEKFWEDNPERLKELRASAAYREDNIKQMAEIVNPRGSETYKKGLYFFVMYEQEIKTKKYGELPQVLSWEKFFGITKRIVDKTEGGIAETEGMVAVTEDKTEQMEESYADEPENEDENLDSKTEQVAADVENVMDVSKSMENAGQPEEEKHSEKIAPAQKNIEEREESVDRTKKNEAGTDGEKTEDKPNPEQSTGTETEEIAAKVIRDPEKFYKTRKGYMDTLNEYEMSRYLAGEYERRNIRDGVLSSRSQLFQWLMQEVDDQGREIVDV